MLEHGTLLETMRNEHARLRDSLHAISQTSPNTPQMRKQMFAAFTDDFLLYSRALRNVLYVILENIYESEEQVLEAYGRHEILRQRIRMVTQLDSASGDWEAAFAELRDCFSRHVEDEENYLFGALRVVFDEKALEILAYQFSDERNRLSAEAPEAYSQAFTA